MWRRISVRFGSDAEYGRIFERDLRRGRLLAAAPESPLSMHEHVLVDLRAPQGELGFLARVVAPEIPRPEGPAVGLSFTLSPELLLQLRALCVSEESALRVATTSPTSAEADPRSSGTGASEREGSAGGVGDGYRVPVTGELPVQGGPASTAHGLASAQRASAGEEEGDDVDFILRDDTPPRRSVPSAMKHFTPARGSRPAGMTERETPKRGTRPGPEVIQRFVGKQRHAPQHQNNEGLRIPRASAPTWPPGLPTVVEFRRAHKREMSSLERAEFLDRIQKFIRRSRELEPFELLGLDADVTRAELQQVYSRYCVSLAIRDRQNTRDTDVIRISELVFECLHRAHEELMRRVGATGSGYKPPQGHAAVSDALRPAGADSEPSLDEDEPCRCHD